MYTWTLSFEFHNHSSDTALLFSRKTVYFSIFLMNVAVCKERCVILLSVKHGHLRINMSLRWHRRERGAARCPPRGQLHLPCVQHFSCSVLVTGLQRFPRTRLVALGRLLPAWVSER